jgi:hypothetical protein
MTSFAVPRASSVGEPLAEPQTGRRGIAITERVQRKLPRRGLQFRERAGVVPIRSSGVLTIDVNEGTIDGRRGSKGSTRSSRGRFASEFALRAGDVFNRERAQHALEALTRADARRDSPRPSVRRRIDVHAGRATCGDGRGSFDSRRSRRPPHLLVGLREPPGRFKMVPDLGEREDWFSAVDGFVPSLGFGAAVFESRFASTTPTSPATCPISGVRACRLCVGLRAPVLHRAAGCFSAASSTT